MAARVNFEYQPPGQKLCDFHLSPAFVRVLFGPLGSGKTTACCAEIYRRSVEQAADSRGRRRTRWLVIRNTVPELLTTTLPSWTGIFGSQFGEMNRNPPITHRLRVQLSDKTKVESDIIFLGLDGPDAADKLRGMELTGAWVNECREVPKPVFDMLTGRVGRYPARRDGGPTWFGVIADTNMPDDHHWLYYMAEKERPDTWQFFRQIGGVSWYDGKWIINPDAENVVNLPQRYYENQIAGKADDWIRVYLAAEYGFVREGKPVFPEYSDVDHVADLAPIPGVPIDVGADFGLTPAAVIAQRAPSGRIHILREMVTDGVGAVRFGEELSRLLRYDFADYRIGSMTGDPAGGQRAQTDERTVFQILAAMNLLFRPAPVGPTKNEFVIRREAVAKPMTTWLDGKPGLLIDRGCVTIRRGMAGSYHFRRIQVTAERYGDYPEKNHESHVCEALQYLCLGLGEGRVLLGGEYPMGFRPRVVTHRPTAPPPRPRIAGRRY
jgi:hypothetical protein